MKEIGGYFELEELAGKEYYPDLIHLNLGRTALLYILKALETKKLAVPYFLCDSVIETCKNAGIELHFYSIQNNFLPDESLQLSDGEYLYLVNYYGQLSDQIISEIKEKYERVIADYTHCFFQRPLPDVPTLYSCRKYFGLPDGAYVYLPIIAPDLPILQDESSKRMGHILGRYEHSASAHYQEMLDTAHSFCQASLLHMSRLTQNLLKAIPYESISKQRTENFETLHNHFKNFNTLDLIVPEGAFCYPLYYKNAYELKKKLAEKKIFVPTYWSNVIQDMPENSIEYNYAKNILPLPCDQRYNVHDMNYMIEIIDEEITKMETSYDK